MSFLRIEPEWKFRLFEVPYLPKQVKGLRNDLYGRAGFSRSGRKRSDGIHSQEFWHDPLIVRARSPIHCLACAKQLHLRKLPFTKKKIFF